MTLVAGRMLLHSFEGGLVGAITAIPLFAAGRVLILHEIAPIVRRAARRKRHQTDAYGQ